MASRVVAVGGKFDPIHEGHVLHILKASELGDYLYVFLQSDDAVRQGKRKCNIPFAWRAFFIEAVLDALGINGEVIPCFDRDTTSVETLRMCRPDVWAKGGDRAPENMVRAEIDVCKEIGCEIIYDVGEQLNSSSSMEING